MMYWPSLQPLIVGPNLDSSQIENSWHKVNKSSHHSWRSGRKIWPYAIQDAFTKPQCLKITHKERCVTILKVCDTNEGKSHLWRYVKLMKVCQSFGCYNLTWLNVKYWNILVTEVKVAKLFLDNTKWLKLFTISHFCGMYY